MGGLLWGSLCEGSHYFGSILGAPDLGNSHVMAILRVDIRLYMGVII